MANMKSSLDYWRKFFSCAKVDILELIDKAILVAVVDYSNEFNDIKDMILEKQRNPQLSHNNGNTNPKEEKKLKATEIGRPVNALRKHNTKHIQKLAQSLVNGWKELVDESVKSTAANNHLERQIIGEATEIGRPVNALRKRNSKHIQKLAQSLVNGWKEFVDEWVKSDAANQVKEVSTIDFGNGYSSKLSSKQNPSSHFSEMRGKASNSPQKNSEQSNEISDMSKLENTKRKLIEGYQRIEHAKKQKMIKFIDPSDLPMDSHEKERRKKKA
ncbi:probable mediator of RNA polymerase II transcription subunit 26c [Dendrobium catenatum]|uniref:probable mediator of RNA polymerase II transcription subunit 26c n=1 Tax=Dendrobium catenatum TaxID=906689 RepID=UPI0009F43D93|nr:probable mediator of RNA polymerase II transcription subunit 26c [Dendrobium catenatum]